MLVFCCPNCKYVDVGEEYDDVKCAKCGASMLSLGLSTLEWNQLDNDQMKKTINDRISGYKGQQDIKQPVWEEEENDTAQYTQKAEEKANAPKPNSSENLNSKVSSDNKYNNESHNTSRDSETSGPVRKKLTHPNQSQYSLDKYLKDKAISSKFTWADAPLKWHEFYSWFLWIQLVLGIINFVSNTLQNITDLENTEFQNVIYLDYTTGIISIALGILLALNLKNFEPIAYKLLWLYYIFLIAVQILAFVIICFLIPDVAWQQTSTTIGGIIGILVWAIPILIYYWHRKSLFYTTQSEIEYYWGIKTFPARSCNECDEKILRNGNYCTYCGAKALEDA